MREIIEQGVMLSGAIVPERDRIRLPMEPAYELRRLAVTIQHLQHRVALVRLELNDPGREALIDE